MFRWVCFAPPSQISYEKYLCRPFSPPVNIKSRGRMAGTLLLQPYPFYGKGGLSGRILLRIAKERQERGRDCQGAGPAATRPIRGEAGNRGLPKEKQAPQTMWPGALLLLTQ